MKDKDQLKDILNNIDSINKPINLEDVIMQSIRKDELIKDKITNYKKQGIRGLIISFILVIALVLIYSLQTVGDVNLKYTSIGTCLILIFAQLELGGLKFINQIKNNKS